MFCILGFPVCFLSWVNQSCEVRNGSFQLTSCKRSVENLEIFIFSMAWLCFVFTVVMERRYPKEVQDLYETMRRFARIVGPVEHDKFIESHARRCFLSLAQVFVCVCSCK